MQVAQFEGWAIPIDGFNHIPRGNKWKKAHYFVGYTTPCGLEKKQDFDRFTIIKPSSKNHRCKMCLSQIERYGSPQRAIEVVNDLHTENPNIIRKLDWRKLKRIGRPTSHKPVEKKLVYATCAEDNCSESGVAFEPTEGKPKSHYCVKHNLKIKEALKLA